jgi:hypothetical protein
MTIIPPSIETNIFFISLCYHYTNNNRHAVRLLLDSVSSALSDEEKLKLQTEVIQKLNAATKSLPPNAKVTYLGLPKVHKMTIVQRETSWLPLPPQVKKQIIEKSSGVDDKPKYFAFHYNPYEKKLAKKAPPVIWVKEEIASLAIELENPLLVDILAQSVSVIFEGV